jgi:hypothetical protein
MLLLRVTWTARKMTEDNPAIILSNGKYNKIDRKKKE